MQPGLLQQHLVPPWIFLGKYPTSRAPPVAAIIEEQLQGKQGCYDHGGTGEADLTTRMKSAAAGVFHSFFPFTKKFTN